MDLAWLAEQSGTEQVMRAIAGPSREFNLEEGDELAWDGSFCVRVLDGRLPSYIPDTRLNPITAALPVREQVGIGSYIGAPVRTRDGKLFGMLCCISRGTHTALQPHQIRLLEAIANSMGEELGEEQARQARPDSMLSMLEAAVDGERIAVVVQPIVQLATMQISGVEALTRFDFPSAKPNELFAEADAHGFGVLLEMSAINSALRMIDELPSHMYVSINTSPTTLCSSELRAALTAIDATRVVVELTEHSSVANYETLLQAIDSLRRIGIRLAIDDAGAGYASFRHILSLHPDIIKMDRELVTGVDIDPVRRSLISAFVTFASHIGATLVAEGIETQAELDTIARLGVTSGQGYVLARPGHLPLPEITVKPLTTRIDEPAATAESSAEDLLNAILREVVAHTGLETSFFTMWDRHAQTLTPEAVYDPSDIGIHAHDPVPWAQTPCYRCRQAGILWSADIEKDLVPDTNLDASVMTYMSVPVLNGAGELLGTLCGASRKRRYISDPSLDVVRRLGIDAATTILRRRRSGRSEPLH